MYYRAVLSLYHGSDYLLFQSKRNFRVLWYEKLNRGRAVRKGWPIALSGHDMIGLAQTGSGKTLGFALPAMVHIMAQDYLQAGDGPIALMLAPTRELALQIKAECDKFGASSQIKNTCVYG